MLGGVLGKVIAESGIILGLAWFCFLVKRDLATSSLVLSLV